MKNNIRILIAYTVVAVLGLTFFISTPDISAQPTIASFTLPNGETTSASVLYASNNLWVLGYETGYLYRLSVPG